MAAHIGHTPAAQPAASASHRPQHRRDLPNELSIQICEELLPVGSSFTGKQDLINMSQVNKQMNEIARPMLFRHLTVTFTLKDDFPLYSQSDSWKPLPWKESGVLEVLQTNPTLRQHVQSMRLRIYPWPVKNWTEKRIDQIVQLLINYMAVLGQSWDSDFSSGFLSNLDFPNNLRQGALRHQRMAMRAYAALNRFRTQANKPGPFTRDLFAVCREAMAQLPRLEYVEALEWDGQPRDDETLDAAADALRYAESIIFHAIPGSVHSLTLKDWPAAYPRYVYTKPKSITSRAEDFARIGPQLDNLAIVFPQRRWRRDHPDDIYDSIVDEWRKSLRKVQYLTSLSLSASFMLPMLPEQVLENLFAHKVILHSLKVLKLKNWTVPATFFTDHITAGSGQMPALTMLELRQIAIRCADKADGTRLWLWVADELIKDEKLVISCPDPMICRYDFIRNRRRDHPPQTAGDAEPIIRNRLSRAG